MYFLSVAGDDVESQQKGIVVLIWPDPGIADTIRLRFPVHRGGELAHKVLKFSPVRVAAYHFCTPSNSSSGNPFFGIVGSVFALETLGRGNHQLSRLKFHAGEPTELRYKIGGYGIPVDLLPLTPTGNVKTNHLKQWMRLRATVESANRVCIGGGNGSCGGNGNGNGENSNDNSNDNNNNTNTTNNINNTNNRASYGISTMIECPGSLDVVFRPGRPVMNHPGNVAFRSLIESMSEQHDTASQTEKSAICKQVVDETIRPKYIQIQIQTNNTIGIGVCSANSNNHANSNSNNNTAGRFLVWDEPNVCWAAILDPNKRRDKVAIAFRNFKSHKRATMNRQTNKSSQSLVKEQPFGRLDYNNCNHKKRKRTTCSRGAFCFM